MGIIYKRYINADTVRRIEIDANNPDPLDNLWSVVMSREEKAGWSSLNKKEDNFCTQCSCCGETQSEPWSEWKKLEDGRIVINYYGKRVK